jgi:hypothetical protein
MSHRSHNSWKYALAVLACVTSLHTSSSRAESPFDGLRGSWSGGGTVRMTDGGQERIRCAASYSPSGANLQMTLRCASDSYKVNLTGQITSSGGKLSGKWSEASRQINGDLTGTAKAGIIQASATGPAFSAALNVRTTGSTQSITIQAPGTPVSNVAIALKR